LRNRPLRACYRQDIPLHRLRQMLGSRREVREDGHLILRYGSIQFDIHAILESGGGCNDPEQIVQRGFFIKRDNRASGFRRQRQEAQREFRFCIECDLCLPCICDKSCLEYGCLSEFLPTSGYSPSERFHPCTRRRFRWLGGYRSSCQGSCHRAGSFAE